MYGALTTSQRALTPVQAALRSLMIHKQDIKSCMYPHLSKDEPCKGVAYEGVCLAYVIRPPDITPGPVVQINLLGQFCRYFVYVKTTVSSSESSCRLLSARTPLPPSLSTVQAQAEDYHNTNPQTHDPANGDFRSDKDL